MTNVSKRQDAVNLRADGRSPAAEAVSEMVVHVFRLNGLLTAAGDEMAEPAGQTSARWRVLAAIEDAPLTVPQVARAWWLTRQSVQRVADALVEDGLAEYELNPKHHRSKLLRIAPRGRSALRAIRGVQRTWAEELGAEIGQEDLRVTNAVLARVVGAMAGRRTPG